MSEYSIEELRAAVHAAMANKMPSIANMLTAYADLIEQIERAREGVTEEAVHHSVEAYVVSDKAAEVPRFEAMRAAIQSVAHLLPSGERGVGTCPRCNGAGEYMNYRGNMSQMEHCHICDGTGKAPNPPAQTAQVDWFTDAQVDWLITFNARLIVNGLHPEDARLWMRATDQWDFDADPVAEADSTWQDFFANPDDDGPVDPAPTAEPVAQGEADDCCDICHEPLSDNCACRNEYAREHDLRSER